MCCARLAGNTGPKKSPKSRHLGTIAQLCRAMSSQLRHASTIGKENLLSSDMSSTCPHNMANFGLLTAEICGEFGAPLKIQPVSRLGSVTARHLHRESKKGCHPNHGYNFVNSWSICKILSLLQTAVNVQQNSYWVTHHTLCMLLHYLGKLKNQKFVLCMHVKHVSSVIFYHLSNRYLPNVMKISAKISTMQNINILLFVRLLSLTNWRNA